MQRFGIGKLLLDQVENYARETSYNNLTLDTRPFLKSALRLYENYGYKRTSARPRNLFGTPLYEMEKSLVETNQLAQLTIANDNDKFQIITGTLEDVEELVRHRQLMWQDIYQGKYENEIRKSGRKYGPWIRRLIRNHEMIVFVARRKGQNKILASGGLWLTQVQSRPMNVSGKTAYLLSMYTDPKYRGHGLASRIVQAATIWCKQNGYPDIVLHASPMGRRIYGKFGFKRTWEMKLELSGLESHSQ
jgi:GNAT superfamily N-acetyltransferase